MNSVERCLKAKLNVKSTNNKGLYMVIALFLWFLLGPDDSDSVHHAYIKYCIYLNLESRFLVSLS